MNKVKIENCFVSVETQPGEWRLITARKRAWDAPYRQALRQWLIKHNQYPPDGEYIFSGGKLVRNVH